MCGCYRKDIGKIKDLEDVVNSNLIRALSWSLWISHIRTPPGDNRRMWAGTLLSRRLEVGPDTDTTQLLRAMWKEDDDRGSPDSDLTQEIRNRFAYNMKGIGW